MCQAVVVEEEVAEERENVWHLHAYTSMLKIESSSLCNCTYVCICNVFLHDDGCSYIYMGYMKKERCMNVHIYMHNGVVII